VPDKLVKILLVEDSESDASLLREEILQSNTGDHQIKVAGSLQQAIDYFKNNQVDATLLDLNLPDSSGLETVRAVMSFQPDAPIVVLTGFDDEKTGIEAVRMGAQDYLVKGRSDGRLISRAVRYAIERKKMEVELRKARDELEIRVEERTRTIKRQSRFLEAYFQYSLTTVMFLDRNFNFLRVNDEFARACQKRAADFPGHNYFEFFPDPGNKAIFENAVRTNTPYVAVAKPFVFQDQPELGIIYCDWTLVPIRTENGEVELLILSLKDVTERVRAERRILDDQQQLRALTAELLMVEEGERRKIASELHDSVGQILAFLKIELGDMQRSKLPKESVSTIRHLREQVERAIEQTRSLTFEMSPPELYTLGLGPALEELAQRFSEERGLACSVDVHDGSYPLSDQVKILLYRAVRELLINAAKHARAQSVQIKMNKAAGNIEIVVEDNGVGFDASRLDRTRRVITPGFGLFSIRERLGQMGGKLEINSEKGRGTKITLSAPLEQKVPKERIR
jgi:PAS domain S-box-containing protein